MGLRPAAEPPDSLPIVQKALAASKAVGITIFATRSGSTDSNIPMSLGIPAITIGGGGNAQGAHSIDESYEETPDSYKGPQWAALILQALTSVN